MIIKFSPNLFSTNNPDQLSKLAKLLNYLTDNYSRHKLDTSGLMDKFYINGKFFLQSHKLGEYIGKVDYEKIEKLLVGSDKELTSVLKYYLTSIKIGYEDKDNEIEPETALRILSIESKIVLENRINDWKFIKGVTEKYCNHKVRRSIYSLIRNAITNEWLLADTGGGIGEITKTIESLITSKKYDYIYKYKIMTIFDSDKQNEGDQLGGNQIKIIEFVKGQPLTTATNVFYEDSDKVFWHMLYKRKLENYLPINVLLNEIKKLSETQKEDIKCKSPKDLDYIEYNFQNIGLGEKEIKSNFPEYFLAPFSYALLEDRCAHHKKKHINQGNKKEDITELEEILLKIARII